VHEALEPLAQVARQPAVQPSGRSPRLVRPTLHASTPGPKAVPSSRRGLPPPRRQPRLVLFLINQHGGYAPFLIQVFALKPSDISHTRILAAGTLPWATFWAATSGHSACAAR